MSYAVPSLVALTLLVCGAVASLPLVVTRTVPKSQPPLTAEPLGNPHWIVEAPGDRWFVDGAPISRLDLANRLRLDADQGLQHFLPSASLSMGEVKRSLQWLRSLSPHPVLLDLPERSPS
ncbi:MAG: hypothetical protein NTZ40_11905 [Cyanobacteria bacterium]|nr:hypothetical protein [Cyanobacteriota bacterium]